MRHAIRYEGGYERNFTSLRPGAAEFDGDDDQRHTMVAWPAGADGLRFGFMERQGKRYVAVRVQYGPTDIVVPHGVVIDQTRHLAGRRLGPDPVPLADEPASALLGDIIDANPECRADLVAVRDRVRHAMAPQTHTGSKSPEPRA
jgi:hypothetical protein